MMCVYCFYIYVVKGLVLVMFVFSSGVGVESVSDGEVLAMIESVKAQYDFDVHSNCARSFLLKHYGFVVDDGFEVFDCVMNPMVVVLVSGLGRKAERGLPCCDFCGV